MAAPSLQGDNPASGQGEGAPSGDSVVPASGAHAAQIGLILEAVVGVLQGVPVAAPALVRLQAGAQALQTGGKPLSNTAGNEAWRAGSVYTSSQRGLLPQGQEVGHFVWWPENGKESSNRN